MKFYTLNHFSKWWDRLVVLSSEWSFIHYWKSIQCFCVRYRLTINTEREKTLELAFSVCLLSLNYRLDDLRLKSSNKKSVAALGLNWNVFCLMLLLHRRPRRGMFVLVSKSIWQARGEISIEITEIEVSTWVASPLTAPAWFTHDSVLALK